MQPPFAPIPAKTPLGVEEQRRRSAGLGQRHRTILFLVDGRRPLGEVLRLAQQAGATVQHFEDLVRLGHVEVPRPPEPPPAPAEPEVDEVTALSVDALEPSGDAEAGADAPAAEPAGAADAVDSTASAAAPAAPEAEAPPPPAPGVEPLPPVAAEPAPAMPAAASVAAPAPAAAAAPPPSAPTQTPWASAPVLPAFSLDLPPAAPPAIPVLGEVAVPRVSGAPLVPVGPPPWRKRLQVAAPISREDEKVLGAARERLMEALNRDPPLFGWGLAARIRAAATAPALVDVTLELERTCDRRRRSPAGLAALEAARELLGLGNTVIDEDSRPAAWLDTR